MRPHHCQNRTGFERSSQLDAVAQAVPDVQTRGVKGVRLNECTPLGGQLAEHPQRKAGGPPVVMLLGASKRLLRKVACRSAIALPRPHQGQAGQCGRIAPGQREALFVRRACGGPVSVGSSQRGSRGKSAGSARDSGNAARTLQRALKRRASLGRVPADGPVPAQSARQA